MTDEQKATVLTGCEKDDLTDYAFCATHDEDGNPAWDECRWAPVAAALADERASARAPFLALADEYDRGAGLIRAQEESVGGVDVVQRWRAFQDAAESIRRVATEAS